MSITNYNQYAGKIISKHLHVLNKQKDGAKLSEPAECIECIHKMRTSSRRIRNAFWIFRDIFSKKNLRKWKRQLRKSAKSLGEARDLDTQIIFVKEFRRKLPRREYKPGTGELLQILIKKRRKLQKDVVKALDKLEKAGTLTKIKKALKKAAHGSKKKNIDKLYGLGKKLIMRRVNDLLKLEPFVHSPHRIKELHNMRIAAKKLRYTLESFRPFYGNKTGIFISSARQIQAALGKLHDFDVWIKLLPASAGWRTKEKKNKDLKNAVTYFINNCRVFRSQTYREFVEIWKRQKQAGIWEKLVGWVDR
ncbi:MAG: CHAD domain-containing protein [Elusimicrobia bacterium]|nr:CHAD domain-containing protein [Elusimicrobiota bacterium]